MKIIAKTDKGLLLEATERDVANILGYGSTYSDGFDNRMLKIGTEIPVHKIVSTADAVRTMNTGRLNQIKSNLQNAITQVEAAEDSINQLNLFEKLKEE